MSPAAAADVYEDDVVIWERSLRERMQAQQAKQTTTEQQPTIFKVPKNIRDAAGDSKAYEPQIISLGPYHRGKSELKPMEDNLKWHYLNQFLVRIRQYSSNSLKDCLTKIRDMEPLARGHYAESEELGKICSKDFVEMMLLDGCFVVEVLLTYSKNDVDQNYNKEPNPVGISPSVSSQKSKEADPIGSAIWILPLVALDMMLLENQLPFCILQTLFGVYCSCATEAPSPSTTPVSGELAPYSTQQRLSELVVDFYSRFLPKNCKGKVKKIGNVNHVLHLLHYCIAPYGPPKTQDNNKGRSMYDSKEIITQQAEKGGGSGSWLSLLKELCAQLSHPKKDTSQPHYTPRTIPSAKELNEAGVKLKDKTGSGLSFLDVTFRKGKMEIPHIFVDDETCSFFKNLIAFEQCYTEADHTYVTAYALFMDCLIDTPEDAALLKQNRIITSGLGNDNDIADLFNKLCKEVTIDYDACYLSVLFKDVNRHCSSKWNRFRAWGNRNYFSNPWASISFAAGIFLFVFTIIQTVFSVVAYVWPT